MKNVVASLLAIVLFASAGTQAQYDPSTAWSALQFCKTAYCDAGAISSWSCGPACQFHSQFQIQGVYHNASIESQGFSGYDPSMGAIVVAFRGSSNIPNWISDLDFIKTTYPNPACGCEVHRGFLGEWLSMSYDVLNDVNALLSTHGSNTPVFVTGHSLGAAVSILAAMDIITHATANVMVYNFGEPRVGDSTFAAWAAGRLSAGKQYRVTHERDPVPHVPPMDFGFLHTPHELWYDNDGNSSWSNCADSATAEDPNCSDSVIPFGVWNHLLYLGICTECTCSSDKLSAKYGADVVAMLSTNHTARKAMLKDSLLKQPLSFTKGHRQHAERKLRN